MARKHRNLEDDYADSPVKKQLFFVGGARVIHRATHNRAPIILAWIEHALSIETHRALRQR